MKLITKKCLNKMPGNWQELEKAHRGELPVRQIGKGKYVNSFVGLTVVQVLKYHVAHV
jgi:hypothetical protein